MLVSCPTTNPPAGVLYNHVSKTGGTSFAARLHALKSPDMPLVKAGSREEMSQIKLGRDGALVAQVDTEPIQVIASDAARFFVIGLVRRPCDYARSVWSFRSARCASCDYAGVGLDSAAPTARPRLAKHNYSRVNCSEPSFRAVCDSGRYGATPPYASASDLARFDRWVRSTWRSTQPRGLAKGMAGGLTSELTKRLGAANLSAHVHCWVRTHEMDAGLVACLEAYGETCGGRLGASQRQELDRRRVAQEQQQPASRAHSRATGARMQSAPTASGQPCSTYFTAAANAAVLSRDADLIDRFGLGSCCSD